jgi:hypothetical protein
VYSNRAIFEDGGLIYYGLADVRAIWWRDISAVLLITIETAIAENSAHLPSLVGAPTEITRRDHICAA